MLEILDDVGHCVDAVLRRVGPRIVLALPLGIGKPNPLVNEFYRRALRDSSIDLTIVTALSLLKPVARSALEARLLAPLAARVFGTYVEPEYARAMQTDTLPPNVRILEFFLTPGAFLDSRHAQRHYLSANYTHVARDCLARGVNVIAHLLAQRSVNGELQLSLGSNPDVTVDLLPLIEGARAAGRDIVMVGQTRSEEHTSELQSQSNLVCRLLLEKKKTNNCRPTPGTNKSRLRNSLICSSHISSLFTPTRMILIRVFTSRSLPFNLSGLIAHLVPY